MKRLVFVFAVLATATIGRAETINRIVATVDGQPVTLRELEAYSGQMNDRAAMMHPQGTGDMSQRDFLDALLMNKMIENEVDTQGLRAKDVDIDSYIERIKNQGGLDDEQLEAALADQGMSMERYRKQIAQEIEQALLMNKEVGSRVSVPDEAVQRYYEAHREDYATPDQVRIRHIFLPLSPGAGADEELKMSTLMETLHGRAVRGEDFAILASTYSLGPGADQGGDLGFFERGQMDSDIERIAFSIPEGAISQPFLTPAGVHLIKVEERDTEGVKPLAEVQEEIRTQLYSTELSKRYRRWFQDDLRFRHHIEDFLTDPEGVPYMGVQRVREAQELEDELLDEEAASAEEEDAAAPVAQEQPQDQPEEPGFFSRLFADDEAEEDGEAEVAALDGQDRPQDQSQEQSQDQPEEPGFFGRLFADDEAEEDGEAEVAALDGQDRPQDEPQDQPEDPGLLSGLFADDEEEDSEEVATTATEQAEPAAQAGEEEGGSFRLPWF